MIRIKTKIRSAAEGDCEPVAALALELGYAVSAKETRERLRRLGGRPDHAVLVAQREGEVVGWLHVMRKLSLEAGEYAEIGGMVVHEAFRSWGIGVELVRAAEAWAEKQGLAMLRVRSNVARERAHSFYGRLGFGIAKSQRVFQKVLAGGS